VNTPRAPVRAVARVSVRSLCPPPPLCVVEHTGVLACFRSFFVHSTFFQSLSTPSTLCTAELSATSVYLPKKTPGNLGPRHGGRCARFGKRSGSGRVPYGSAESQQNFDFSGGTELARRTTRCRPRFIARTTWRQREARDERAKARHELEGGA